MDLPSTVHDEIAEVRESFPKLKIKTSTSSFLIASYQRTDYTCIKFTLAFPDGYPDHSLIVDVNADSTVPPGLKKKLEHDLSADLPLGHYQQIITVVTRLIQFVDHNKFLPCWKELKQSMTLVKKDTESDGASSKSSISIIESKGKIKLKLHCKKYFYNCSIVIDDGYPSTTTHEDWGKACILKMESTNFPPKIESMLTTQAREVVRRMQDGMTQENALLMSNPIEKPKNLDSEEKDEVKPRLTGATLKGLKQDIETLSRVRDLREVNSSRTQGTARVQVNANKIRKQARRTITKITKEEISKDEQAEKQWQADEQARIAQFDMHDGNNPQPSLLALVTFLQAKIQRLPTEKCPCCQSLTLPADPNKLQSLYKSSSECKTAAEKKARKEARAFRPIRCYCGCWYHYKCLNKFMTEPPFGASCPTAGCGRRVYHPDWPGDIKQLERTWASHQARLREIDDAAMFI